MSKKVLIADDNAMNVELLQDILERFKTFGLIIFTASDGKEAYEKAKKEKPDLILLDVQMPEMDGYEVCEKLKNDPATKDIYIIMVTAQTETENRRKAAVLGVDEYITKPFDVRLVRERVKSVLDLKSL